MKRLIAAILCLLSVAASAKPKLGLRDVGEASDARHIEIRGVAAGAFDPAAWQAGALHLLPDARRPLLSPRDGKFRNIYAPSVVQVGDKWHLYYGGWDGEAAGNDHIYLAETRDFLTFDNRRTVIAPNVFQHVCNVNVTAARDGYAMMCTALPDAQGRNKPVTFFSKGGARWNGPATRERIIGMEGYPGWADADVNGMNVLLFEDGKYRVYFSNFREFGKTWRASGDDGKHFNFEDTALEMPAMVNDVKKFVVPGESSARAAETWYLMGLHQNGDRLSYSLSRDGMKFSPARELLRSGGADDRYIVAIGWVVAGEQESPGRRVLGLLYGAGAAPSLDKNRIFGAWLQKKAVAVTANGRIEPKSALGPDAQRLPLDAETRATIELLAEDGLTLLGTVQDTPLKPGRVYAIELRP